MRPLMPLMLFESYVKVYFLIFERADNIDDDYLSGKSLYKIDKRKELKYYEIYI